MGGPLQRRSVHVGQRRQGLPMKCHNDPPRGQLRTRGDSLSGQIVGEDGEATFSGSPSELCHCGGTLAREPDAHGVVASLPRTYLTYCVVLLFGEGSWIATRESGSTRWRRPSAASAPAASTSTSPSRQPTPRASRPRSLQGVKAEVDLDPLSPRQPRDRSGSLSECSP